MKKQKGQVLVEFALVLPFFLLLIFGIIYSGMLFYDYSTLSNVARSAARERAISPSTITNDQIVSYYVQNGKFIRGQITSLYSPGSPPLNLRMENDDIIATVNMQLGSRSHVMEVVLPDRYSIVSHMRKDYKETNP